MKKGISQEGLKLIACVTMLMDHIGYELVYPLFLGMQFVEELYFLCRIIGRISFPIFAFLQVEGFHRSHSRKQYALRLVIGALLAELPYDLMVYGRFSWGKQSVMLTLLLGFCVLLAMEKIKTPGMKALVMLPFAAAAELMKADYGFVGIMLVGMFELSRYSYRKNLIRTMGMVILFHYMSSYVFWIGNISIPMQVLGVLSMLFIANYDGRKLTRSNVAKWAFYLFYPVHMLILWAVGTMIH